MLIHFDFFHLLIGVGLLCFLLPFLWLQKRSLSFLVFFSVFWFYLLAVVAVVIFPITVNTLSDNTVFTPSINLIPFDFGSCFSLAILCMRSIFENIALTIPFGFGMNFLAKIKPRSLYWLALSIGFVFELTQLGVSLVLRSGFRAFDINDVILNGTGVLVGFALFRLFAWLFTRVANQFDFKSNWLLARIHDVVVQAQVAGRSKGG